MKKLISVLFVLALLLSATACGSTDEGASTGTYSESDGQYVGESGEQHIDESVPEGVTFDSTAQSNEPVKSVMVYASNSEMFFNNTYESLGPGLLRITYNAQNGRIDEFRLAFYNKNSDAGNDNVYKMLTDAEGTYVNCVTDVRYEGKYILANGVKGYINLSGLDIGSSYDRLLEDCRGDKYTQEYSENVYFTWDFYKGIYFYDNICELDLSVLEKEFSWNEGKDTAELSSLLAYNEYGFKADDGSEQTLEVRIANDNMCGFSVFSNYISPVGTDAYKIDGKTMIVIGSCMYKDEWHAYAAELTFSENKLTAVFYLYDENEELTFDNYSGKTALYTLTFDCTAV